VTSINDAALIKGGSLLYIMGEIIHEEISRMNYFIDTKTGNVEWEFIDEGEEEEDGDTIIN
jgi:hypothetical protein